MSIVKLFWEERKREEGAYKVESPERREKEKGGGRERKRKRKRKRRGQVFRKSQTSKKGRS